MAKKKNETGSSCPRADIGGQAVLDGVMMKSPDAVAVAVRRPKTGRAHGPEGRDFSKIALIQNMKL